MKVIAAMPLPAVIKDIANFIPRKLVCLALNSLSLPYLIAHLKHILPLYGAPLAEMKSLQVQKPSKNSKGHLLYNVAEKRQAFAILVSAACLTRAPPLHTRFHVHPHPPPPPHFCFGSGWTFGTW